MRNLIIILLFTFGCNSYQSNNENVTQAGLRFYKNLSTETLIVYLNSLLENQSYSYVYYLHEKYDELIPDSIEHEIYFESLLMLRDYEKLVGMKRVLPDKYGYYSSVMPLYDSINIYTTFIDEYSRSGELYNNRGNIFLKIGQLQAAENDFARANQMDAKNDIYFENYIYVLLIQERFSEIREELRFRRTTTNHSINSKVDFYVSIMEQIESIRSNKMPDFKKEFETAKLFLSANALVVARQHLENSVKLNPSEGDTHALLAMCYLKLGYPVEAYKIIMKAEEISGKKNTPLGNMIREAYAMHMKNL